MTARPRLVVGLGGALSGDDAVGLLLADLLARDPRLPPDVDVVTGGADLLRLGRILAAREHVVLLDAIEARPGEAEPIVADHPIAGLLDRQAHAHHLSAVQGLDLLLLSEGGLQDTRFTWFLVPVSRVAPGTDASPDLARRLAHLRDALVALLIS